MSDNITVSARVFRSGENGEPSRFDTFEVTGPRTMRVLEVLRHIYDEHDGSLAYQFACRVARCGTCSVRVNGRPVLACQERVKKTMTIEPLTPFPVIRDLVIDRSRADEHYASLELVPKRRQEHPGTIDKIPLPTARKIGNLGSCISCLICVSICPAVDERSFDGPAFMLQLRRLAEYPADQGARLEQALEGGLTECFGCDQCTQICPADLSPADAIRDFRREAILGTGKKPSAVAEGAGR